MSDPAPSHPRNLAEFKDFMADADKQGVAAMLYVHVHPDGIVTVYERGNEGTVLQAAIVALEWLTARAKPPENN